MANTDTTAALARLDHGEHQALLAPASAHGRFVVVLTSSVIGELERKWASTRVKAFEAMRDLATECLAREAERRWLHGEIVSIRVEADGGQ